MRDFIEDLTRLNVLLSKTDKQKLLALLFLMLVGAVLEAIGISAVPIFVSSVIKPSSLSEVPLMGQWFSGLPDEPSVNVIIWTGSLIFGFILLKNVFLSYIQYVQARVVTSQRVEISDNLFKAYLSAPYEWHLQRSSSELIRNLETDTAQIVNGVIYQLLTLIMSLIMASLIITVMVIETPGPAFVTMLIMGTGLFAVVRIFQNKLQRLGEIRRDSVKYIFQAIQQGFGGLVYAKIANCEDYLSGKHRESLARYCSAERQRITIQKATPYAMETIVVLGLVVVLVLLVQTTESLSDVLPLVALLGVATLRLKQIMSQVANTVNQINVARASIPGIVEDFEELTKINPEGSGRAIQGEGIDTFQSLHLENVEYAYPGVDDNALQNVSLDVKRGESIAFVGATGSGKSTLLNLILGLLKPQTGFVRVNGKNTIECSADWSGLMGYIPQSIYLVDDSIRANIAFGVAENEVDEARLASALRTASLEEFVGSLPDGINTVVGERGVRLSGGQQQRLGIARALYPNPEVLVMDEASSSLDNKTEQDVMRAIQNLKRDRTLIVVAHRLNTVKESDRLYFLNNGKIECTGTYEALFSESSAFREMVALI